MRTETCLDAYRRWLHLTDDDQPTAALAGVAANLIAGDPLWLLFVGSPGSGKTETINPLDTLPYIHSAASFTEAAYCPARRGRIERRAPRAGCCARSATSGSSSPRTSPACCR